METQNKNWYLLIGGLILILILLMWFKGCGGVPKTITVTTPAIHGTTVAVKPETIVIHDTVYKKIKLAADRKEIDSLIKRNVQLEVAFAMADNKEELYKKAIELNDFNHTFEDTILKATVSGISRGTVQSIKLDYTIKPHTDVIKVPQTRFRLLGGAEVGMTKELSKFNVKANIGLQNAKGNVFSISADTDQRFYIGYGFSLFSF